MSPPITPTLWGHRAPTLGITPALALINPKYPANVGMVVRLASCYGVRQVWFTGNRVSLDPAKGGRLPREERMKGYRDVQMVHYDYFFDRFPAGAVPQRTAIHSDVSISPFPLTPLPLTGTITLIRPPLVVQLSHPKAVI